MTAAEIQTLINAAKSSEADLVTWTELRAILEGLKNQEGAEGDYTLDMLEDVDIDGFLDDAQVLRWNGTAWVNEVLTTDDIAEGDNLFFTISRSRNAISGGTGISYNPATGEITSAITQYTSAMARAAISLTTTGSGEATYNSSTGELNIPTPSSVNIYTANGTLTGNRTVTMAGNNLTFTGGNIAFGTTVPSPVQSAPFFLFLGAGGVISSNAVGTTTELNLASNVYFDGTNSRYRQARPAAQIYMGNDGHLQFITYPTGTVGGIATGTERMRVFNTGNIGINTTTDAGFRLDVNGTARFTQGVNLATSAGNVGIGTASPGEKLTVIGSSGVGKATSNSVAYAAVYNAGAGFVALQQRDGTSSRYGVNGMSELTSSGTGGLAIVSASGAIHFGTSSTEMMRIFTSGNIGINTTTDAGFRLDVNGTMRVQSDMIVNTFTLGRGAGNQQTNTAFGFEVLNANTGNGNTAVGYRALYLNTSGSSNSAFGREALANNTTGTHNTALGINALNGNTTAQFNVAIGETALFANTTGSNNVAIGRAAGRYLPSGNNTISNGSIFIGVETRPAANSQTNQIVIGNNAVGLGSNTMMLGNSSIVTTHIAGNVLIGTTTDAGFRLDVNGTARVSDNFTMAGNNLYSSGRIRISATGGNNEYLETVASGSFTLASGNTGVLKLGVPTIAPTSGNNQHSTISLSPGTVNATGTYSGFIHGIYVNNSTISSLASGSLAGVRIGTNSATNVWALYVDGSANNYFNGNVGIGLTNPTRKLHVIGDASISDDFFAATSTGKRAVFGATGDADYRVSVDGDLRVYGKIRTAVPDGGTGSGIWKLGSSATGTFTLNTTQCLEVELNGTFYRIATLNPA